VGTSVSLVGAIWATVVASCVGHDPVGTADDGGAGGLAPPDGTIPEAAAERDPQPPGCDTPTEPLKNPEKCLVDSFGAFVSTTGSDSNDGSKKRPFRTIIKALAAGRPRIIVCEGTYAESIDIKADVEIYSGVTCDFTKAGAKAKIVATKADYAVSITAPATAVRMHSVDVEAVDGTEPRANSIAMVVSQAQAVTLVNVSLTSKKGFDGKAGDEGAVGAMGDNGNNATGGAPGALKLKVCNGVTTAGGSGGFDGADGQAGGPNIPENPAGETPPKDGAGGKAEAVDCFGGGFGHSGADAPEATPAAKIATHGTLTTTWQPARGKDGTSGGPGQGGGGGGGIAGNGGGGGTGGCGGTGGKGGEGGGASIALLSLNAKVTVQGSTLRSGAGGRGGDGRVGGAGGRGGGGGSRTGAACQAGSGGQGGKGGAGSGGAGGISVPLVHRGERPQGDMTLSFGTPGTAGQGGAPGVNDGPEGLAQNELEVL